MTDMVIGDSAEEKIGKWPDVVKDDALELLLQDCLGAGVSRAVFPLWSNPELVIKIEQPCRVFQNVLEWEFWNAVKDDKSISKWFAPCWHISNNGRALVMSRTYPLVVNEVVKIPAWIGDRKPENFGYFEGRVVCHDYGTHFPTVCKGNRMTKMRGV